SGRSRSHHHHRDPRSAVSVLLSRRPVGVQPDPNAGTGHIDYGGGHVLERALIGLQNFRIETMATYLLSPDFDAERVKVIESKIRSVIPDLARLGRMDDVAQALSGKSREKSTVLVLATPKDSSYFGKLVELATRHRDRCFFIVISDDIAASDYKRLERPDGPVPGSSPPT